MPYWVAGKKPESGQFVSIGPFGNKLRANQAAEKLDDGEVLELKTSNHTEAQRQIKGKLFMDSSPSLASKIISRFTRRKTTPKEQELEV